jgi:EAL domain-containing protein (putative c-di-GMP-specific phosphodiesterase class I)
VSGAVAGGDGRPAALASHVDDAGSGYAGLPRILALAPHVLKLDLDLICGIDVTRRQALAWA